MKEKVSIYIPTKNRLDFLRKAINSVIEQTYENWELIIVNDASTDGTKNYLDNLVATNPKIKAIHHTESAGACVSRNDALFSATGEFVTGLDDDDFFLPDRLKIFVDSWDENAGVIALCAYFDVDNGKKILKANNLKEKIISQNDLLYENSVGNQVFVKTDDLKKINGFDKDFKMWQDFDCWYRLLSNGNKIKKIPYSTYVWDNKDRTDRISGLQANKVMDTYRLFLKKHNLSKAKANILKFILVEYNLKKMNWSFYIEMLFGTGFDSRTITSINNNFLKPKVYNFLIDLKLLKKKS